MFSLRSVSYSLLGNYVLSLTSTNSTTYGPHSFSYTASIYGPLFRILLERLISQIAVAGLSRICRVEAAAFIQQWHCLQQLNLIEKLFFHLFSCFVWLGLVGDTDWHDNPVSYICFCDHILFQKFRFWDWISLNEFYIGSHLQNNVYLLFLAVLYGRL